MIENMFLFNEIQLGVYTCVGQCLSVGIMHVQQYDKKFKNLVKLLIVNFTNYNYLNG